MYDLINHHIQIILQAIPQDTVTDYDWLIDNPQLVGTAEYQKTYQKTYRNYWRMKRRSLERPLLRSIFPRTAFGAR
jgi:hypothetical protein